MGGEMAIVWLEAYRYALVRLLIFMIMVESRILEAGRMKMKMRIIIMVAATRKPRLDCEWLGICLYKYLPVRTYEVWLHDQWRRVCACAKVYWYLHSPTFSSATAIIISWEPLFFEPGAFMILATSRFKFEIPVSWSLFASLISSIVLRHRSSTS